MSVWQICIANIRRRLSQSSVAALISAVTVGSFVVVLCGFMVVRQGLSLSQERLGADLILLPKDAQANSMQVLFTAEPSFSYMPLAAVENSKKDYPQIDQITYQFFTQTLEETCCSVGDTMRIVGIDPHSDFIVSPWVEQPTGDLQDGEVIVGHQVAGVAGYKMGILGDPYQISGVLHPTGTGMDRTLFVTLERARKMATEKFGSKHLDALSAKEAISCALIKVSPGTDVSALVSQINRKSYPFTAYSKADSILQIQGQMKSLGMLLLVMWLALLVVSGLGLVGRFSALAYERSKDIGYLRALGMQRTSVLSLILLEALLLGLGGGLIGACAGLLVSPYVMQTVQKHFLIPSVQIHPWLFAAAFGSGLLLSALIVLVAAIFPALRLSRIDPQQVLSKGDIE